MLIKMASDQHLKFNIFHNFLSECHKLREIDTQ